MAKKIEDIILIIVLFFLYKQRNGFLLMSRRLKCSKMKREKLGEGYETNVKRRYKNKSRCYWCKGGSDKVTIFTEINATAAKRIDVISKAEFPNLGDIDHRWTFSAVAWAMINWIENSGGLKILVADIGF